MNRRARGERSGRSGPGGTGGRLGFTRELVLTLVSTMRRTLARGDASGRSVAILFDSVRVYLSDKGILDRTSASRRRLVSVYRDGRITGASVSSLGSKVALSVPYRTFAFGGSSRHI
jgi:hypothetical protein